MFLLLLRKHILGPKRFDDAFKEYIHRWAYKHPAPDDFFRTMEDVSGEDLGWFWRSWVLNNWQLDQAVTGVKYIDDNPINGAVITIKNMKEIPMPVKLEVTTITDDKLYIELPVEIWKKNIEWSFIVDTTAAIKKVEIDPGYEYPDVNSKNNIWTPPKDQAK